MENFISTKYEYRNSKQILIFKFLKPKTFYLFGTLKFWILNLFRISNLGFRIFTLGLLFCVLSGCVQEKKITAVAEKEIVPVRVMRVELRDIKNTLDYVGDIKAQDEAVVYPKVNGKILEKIKENGDVVTKGEVIAYVDRDEVGFKFEKAPVESPLDGIIGRVYVDIGTSVTQQTPVALVVNINKVKIDLDVPQEYISKISLGQGAEISVEAYADEVFRGEVAKISPVLDLDTRTAPIEIDILNPQQRLKPGMFARVQLVIAEHKNVPVLLKEAVLGRNGEQYVFVAEQNTARMRKVKLGMRQDAYYEIVEGLKEGDLVVVMGQQKLRDGVAVSVGEEK